MEENRTTEKNISRITEEEAKREPWRAEKEDLPLGERLRKWKSRSEKNLFRYLTVKIIYPFYYSIYRHRKVDPDKVLFVEPSQLKPTNSMKVMLDTVKGLEGYKVKWMSLGHNHVRKRYQLKREIEFIKEYATAGYVFTTEALATVGGFAKRPETTVVQLWHGCGAFKRFGLSTADYRFGSNLETKMKYPDYRNEDIITVSSPEVIWAYEEAMDYRDKGVVQATGISRTDVFFDEKFIKEACDRVAAAVPGINGRKIILYAPTFRGRVKTAYAPESLDLEMLNRESGDEYVILIKQHPHVKDRPKVPESCSSFAWDVTGELTIDDLICAADICISDYSSLVFEYSLFGRPMIFFADDLDDYNDWRGFYYHYDELTPGPVLDRTEDVADYIRNIDTRFDKAEVEDFRYRFMRSCDGHATERILEAAGLIRSKA